jgi:NAD(P)-dependent dehydrogenase (short-subunit alcohol dehydrogenase family)/acyl carrier protein
MIDLDMDIEADLGIDSIKRVEIVAAVEERIPSFTGIKPEYMGSMRTLRQIVSAIEPAPAARGAAVATDRGEGPMPREISPAASADAMNRLTAEVAADAATGVPRDPRTFSETLLAVVSELTGYPGEMLDLAMDLEADLGIDSIKRVEILAAVEARVPAMPTVQPEYMGGLRTLQQIVDYCAGVNAPTQMPAPAPPTQPIPAPGTSPPGEKSLLRRALVPVDLPPVSPSILPVAPGRTVLIVDDGTSLATELAARISAVGFPTRVIDAAAVTVTHENVAALIILATPCGQSGKAWSPQTEKLLKNAFALTKASAIGLMESAAQGGAMFVCISRMDGAFGLLGGEYDPVQGGLAGLAKTAAHEWPGVACRAVDVAQSWDDAVAVADAVLAELSAAGPIEVGLDVATRRGLELIPAACAAGPARISSDDVIVITGGARGVAAETAVALARHYHPRLTLLGRSPAPTDEPAWLSGLESESQIKLAILSNEFGGRARPQQVQAAYDRQMAQREIRRTLSRLAELGAAAEYRSVDVRNADAVRREVSDIRSRFGPVRGLIHAAGVLEDRLIVDKTPEQFARVFDTKVGGLRNLLDALSLHELRHLVLFSSVSARFGNRGQADYAMANEVLNKVAHRLSAQLPDCRVRSLNWGPWDGGMVGPGLKREFLRQGIDLIPLADGADALVAELTDVGPSIEIVLGAGFRPIAPAQPRSPETCAANGHFSLAFERSLDVAGHAFLSSHVLGGRPVLPLAVTMEWLGHAAIHAHPGLLLCGFEDIRVLKGVSLENGEPSLRFFTSEARLDGALLYVPVEMRGDGPDGREVVHASGNAVVAPTLPVAPAIGYSDALAERPFPRSIDEIYSDLLFHGEHFRGIQKVDGWCPRGLVAQLRAAAPPVRWMCDPIRSDWLVDPLILDSAFQMAILWCSEEMGLVSLPSRIARYRQFRAKYPKDGVSAVLEVREHARHKLICDVTFFDLDAAVVARIDGYECTADASLRAAFRRAGIETAS